MEPKDKKQPLSRSAVKHQRKAQKRSDKPQRIALKRAEDVKLQKVSNKPNIKNQKSKRPIQQARLNNH